MKKFKNQLIRILKDEPFFGIAEDGKYMLLYTQHFILSDKDHNAASLISDLWLGGYIKPGKTFTWGKYGIHPSEYNTPVSAAKLYHKYMDAPRSSAEYTLHAYANEFGKVSGYVFAVENADNVVLAENFFKMFNNSHYELMHVGNEVSFIIDGKHIVAPLNVYRTSGFKVVKIGGVADEKD